MTNDAVSDTYLAQPMFTTLTEATLAVALARSIDELDEGRWAVNDTIGYARTASTNEIDLASVAVPTGAGRAWTPIGCP